MQEQIRNTEVLAGTLPTPRLLSSQSGRYSQSVRLSDSIVERFLPAPVELRPRSVFADPATLCRGVHFSEPPGRYLQRSIARGLPIGRGVGPCRAQALVHRTSVRVADPRAPRLPARSPADGRFVQGRRFCSRKSVRPASVDRGLESWWQSPFLVGPSAGDRAS